MHILTDFCKHYFLNISRIIENIDLEIEIRYKRIQNKDDYCDYYYSKYNIILILDYFNYGNMLTATLFLV